MMMFLVTCRHVARGCEEGIVYFMKGEHGVPVMETYPAELNHFQLGWVPHPNENVDIAVLNVNPLIRHLFELEKTSVLISYLREEQFLGDAALRDLNAIEDVTFIGYPAGLRDPKHGIPIARHATTATPIFLNFNGEPVFLIDGAVRKGSSGSPVFIAKQRRFATAQAEDSRRRLWFVGVVAELLRDPYHRSLADETEEGGCVDLGIVYKPSTITQTIDEWLRHAKKNDSEVQRDRLPLF